MSARPAAGHPATTDPTAPLFPVRAEESVPTPSTSWYDGDAGATALKTRLPRPPQHVVERPRLDAALARAAALGPDGPEVVLVTGPAGAGKTTWLSSWAARGPQQAEAWSAAWVTVEDGDDVHSLWTAVLAASAEAGALPSGRVASRLLPDRGISDRQRVAAFARQLAELDRPLWLVLDEVDTLACPEATRSLDTLIRWMPTQLRLVLVGRREPALALHRLRIAGRLLEVRARDLSLTRAESIELLRHHDLELAGAELDLVLERTEGWAAGVRLVAMSLEGADPRAVLTTFAADDRALADYLVGEVLARQPPDVHRFLVETSVCDRLSPDLATAVSGRPDAGALLEDLARSNALTVRLTGPQPWYRYHRLLRSYLSADLARHPAAERAELHRRVARWAAGHGDLMPALEHACRSEDRELIVDLVSRHGLRLALDGHGQALTRLLQRAPSEVRSDPVVALVAAAGALDVEEMAAADDALGLTSPAVAARADPALAATVTLRRAQLLGTAAAELRALAGTDAGASGRRDLDLMATVERGLARLKLGELDAAESDLVRGAAGTQEAGYDHLTLRCLTALAGVASSRDDAAEMARRAEDALSFAALRGWERSPRCAFAHVVAGSGAYQRMDRPTARRHARAALDLLGGTIEPSLRFTAVVLDAALATDEGDDALAQYRRVQRAWPAAEVGLPAVLVAHAALEQQRMALQVGEPAWANDVLRLFDERVDASGEGRYLRAALEAHRGRTSAARRLLRTVCDRTTSCVADRTLVQALVLEAVLADAAGDAAGAHRALADALAVAEARQTVRYLTLAGRSVRALLVRDVGRFGRQDAFAAQVLHALPPSGAGPAVQLTVRERQVLIELPSLRTAEEIAEQQFVSVNTVKTHMRAIYRKLGATNRRDALAAARARGLL